jgi:hypothetical protein
MYFAWVFGGAKNCTRLPAKNGMLGSDTDFWVEIFLRSPPASGYRAVLASA